MDKSNKKTKNKIVVHTSKIIYSKSQYKICKFFRFEENVSR